MTSEEFEQALVRVAQIQRDAGWPESAIMLYAMEQRACTPDPSSILIVGAGLAQDNSRFGVYR